MSRTAQSTVSTAVHCIMVIIMTDDENAITKFWLQLTRWLLYKRLLLRIDQYQFVIMTTNSTSSLFTTLLFEDTPDTTLPPSLSDYICPSHLFRDDSYVPFLPLHDVEDGYHLLENYLLNYYPGITTEAQRFLEYYERTWIRGQSHTHPANWNVVLSTLEGAPRTNNASEGSNNALNRAVGGAKPTFAHLIIKLRQFNARKEMRILQLLQHQTLNSDEKPRKAQRKRNAVLLTAVNTYNRNDMFAFLKKVGVQY